ncbi:hypothetical protein LTR56_026991 [Elasticomyces elasticus]|nr:hypothetical protein LTR56_026991 [Elasticomyces elasticus]
MTDASMPLRKEGVTRMQDLQQKLQSKTVKLDQMVMVLQSLRMGTVKEAATTLVALRRGDSIESITAALPLHVISSFRDVADSSSSRGVRSTYTADVATSSWPVSTAISRRGSYAYGLEASMSRSAFAAHFGAMQVFDRLSAQQAMARSTATSS